MSSRAHADPMRVSVRNKSAACQARHTSPRLPSRPTQDDAFQHGPGSEMKHGHAISNSAPGSPDVHMLSFSLPQQFLQSTAGHLDASYHLLSDFAPAQDLHNHKDLEFSAQDFSNYSAFVDFTIDNDDISIGHSSHTTGDGQMTAPGDAWTPLPGQSGACHGLPMEAFPSTIFHHIPVSPPLTDASNDISITSCSTSGYPAFMTQDDALLGDVTATPTGAQTLSMGDSLFPLTPPLSGQDPTSTIRPTKPARRVAIPSDASSSKMDSDQEFFPSLPGGDLLRPRSKEGAEFRNPRDHPYYLMSAHNDGKYYCPFATGDKACNHLPTTQKCAYHKYLDSHLKPYRCKVSTCMDAQLQFSSNACLFRHEREAHGFHGHGDNPHLCLFEGCDRSVPGYGFPRRWNLFDHMRRVHDYASSERPSSPENVPLTTTTAATAAPAASNNKKKDAAAAAAGRRKRVPGVSGTQTMKRTRSTQSQSSSLKAALSSAHHGQRLQNAERNYYNCRSRLLEELGSIVPQDSSMHEKVNASLQELITLGLNYRHIEASQAATRVSRA